MHRFSFYQSFIVLISLLILTSLACRLGGQDETIGPPGGPIPVSQEASDRLKQNFYQSLQEATSTHEASLRITNEEITSLVANELTSTGQIPLSNPQVWFTSGRIYITGEVDTVGPVNFNSLIVATAVVDEGRMVVRVEEAQMGAFDFPATLVESMTQTVNEILTGVIVDADLDITRLEILEGEMFVIGTRRTS
ncbi:MAG: hypothetical protein HS126_16095 [Anaerolineales bacterium]|nr:hypothetical protein [Anaerolineales bacterium]